MKKVLLVISVACFVLSVSAQKYAFKNIHNQKAVSIHAKTDKGLNGPMLPLNKPTNAHNKSLIGSIIGTSGNSYGLIADITYPLDANPALNAIMFTYRAGGPWGGASGDLRCKISYDLGQTWNDSLVFVNDGTHLYRYPGGIIYNPAGNSTPANAFALVVGPNTNGSGWLTNYFNSVKLDGSNAVNNFVPCLNNKLERIGLSGGNGLYHVMTDSLNADGSWYVGGLVRHMSFNSNTNGFDVNPNFSYLNRNWKFRKFGNDTVEWNSNWNQVFDETGLHGYAYCLGAEQEWDPYTETSLPLLWETWDGGTSWTTWHASGCWHTLSNLTNQIWPTLASMTASNDPTTWVYRPFFEGGSTVDENISPAVIDYQGHIHMFTTVSGMYSNHPDSLAYNFANQPTFLFDVYTTDQFDASGQPQWDVQFVDTLRTDVMQDANSPFTDGTDPIGWGHQLNIATSPDKKVIFTVWADTDPTFDTINTMPELKCRAFNYETMTATPVMNFTPGEGGMYFFVNVPHTVLMDGTDYVIPLTYLDVYETSNPVAAQNLYYVNNMRVTAADFTETISASTITGTCFTGVNDVKANNFNVAQNNPNPAKNNTEIAVTLSENSNLDIVVTNMMGQRVMEINKGMLTSGKHNISINTSSLSSGIYFYTVTANNNSVTKKMVIE